METKANLVTKAICRKESENNNDSLYFCLNESRIVESEEVQPGVILDYDENDQVVGVEFLNVSSRASKKSYLQFNFKPHDYFPVAYSGLLDRP